MLSLIIQLLIKVYLKRKDTSNLGHLHLVTVLLFSIYRLCCSTLNLAPSNSKEIIYILMYVFAKSVNYVHVYHIKNICRKT